MKQPVVFILILVVAVTLPSAAQKDWPVLAGPYLGQKPPGDQREIFAPGIVSTGFNEHSISFTPDGRELFFRLIGPPHGVVLTSKSGPEGWVPLKVASFSGKYDSKCSLSPDGITMMLSGGCPPSGEGSALPYWTIWVIRRDGMGWGKPRNLPNLRGAYPTISRAGTLYFFGRSEDGKQDIYKSVVKEGVYSDPISVGAPVNTEHWGNDPYIAPDESYLIFQSDRPGTLGEGDLFISYRLSDGRWSEPQNLGPGINTAESGEACPWVTPDGRYLFFSSMQYDYDRYSGKPLDLKTKHQVLSSPGYGSEDVFWVSAEIIQTLKPKVAK